MTEIQEGKAIVYSMKQTGLPFDIIKDSHFPSYWAKHPNGMIEKITVSDIINVHILIEAVGKSGQ